jgi:sugar phosphate isomerase/epimerase
MHDRAKKTSGTGFVMSRRRFLGTTAAAAAAYTMLPVAAFGRPGAGIRRRAVEGVQIGAITYSFRALPGSAEDILGYLVQTGMTTTELMGGPAEAFAGAPEAPPWPGRDATEEQRAAFRTAREAYAEEARQWRLSAPMDRFEALRALYNDAGVQIDILKLGEPRWSDEEIDYAFHAARAVGARGISFEISNEAAERMAPFATKHQMLVGMHNHTQVGEEGFSFDVPLSFSAYNMLNFDIGHYVAGTNASPIPIIEKYHDRISHLHIKDRKKDNGDNVPWGEGDTPIGEVLRLLQKKQSPITAMIELEYDIPEGSDVLTEMAKCVNFCREALS